MTGEADMTPIKRCRCRAGASTCRDYQTLSNNQGRCKHLPYLLCAALALPVNALGDNVYVTKVGNAAPEGTLGRPFNTVRAGIAHANCEPERTVVIYPGSYRETMTINAPFTLKSVGGAKIGDRSDVNSTTLRMTTLKTHLFGDDPGPSWQDEPRRDDIAADFLGSNVDIVGFQEIWDEDLFWGGDDQGVGLIVQADYPFGYHGSEVGDGGCVIPTVANSGVAVMSRYPATFTDQNPYGEEGEACIGCLPTDCSPECFVTKSFVTYRFIKAGFDIFFITTHTQSGPDEDQANVRTQQIAEVAGAIATFRQDHPHSSVFFSGDLNIVGETSRYNTDLAGQLGNVGGKDGDRNAPGFFCGGHNNYTLHSDNELAQFFEDGFPFDCGVQVPKERLDYIFYFPSADGEVEIIPEEISVVPFRGPVRCEDDFCSDESSDHYGISARFTLHEIQQ